MDPSVPAVAAIPVLDDPVEALRASERRLELATAAAGLGVWDWDLATGAMVYSPRAKAICGFAPDEEVTYEKARGVTHPDDYPTTSALARRALDPALRDRPAFEYRIVRPDGEVRWVVAHGEAVFDGEGSDARALRYVGTLQDITDRRAAAEALREGEESLRLAQEAGGIGTWSLDLADPSRNRWSPQLYRIRGMPEDWRPDFRGWLDCIEGADRERVERTFADALAPGGRDEFAVAYRFIGRDGVERWQETRGRVRRGADGAAIGAHGIAIDISDRKRAEQELADTVERLRLATEGTGLGTYDLDLLRDEAVWSAPTFEMLGLPVPCDLRANAAAWRGLLHPDDVERVAEEHREAAAAGGSWRIQYRICRADTGEERWLSVYGRFLHEGGVPARSVGIVADVTEQKRAEAEAAAMRHRLDKVTGATPSLIHIFDRQTGRTLWVNGRVDALAGYTAEEVLAMEPFAIRTMIHPDDLPQIMTRYDELEAAPDGHVVECEARMRRRDGRWCWLLDRTVAFERDAQGRVTQTLSAAIDITERKLAEERQALLMNELNHRVKNTLAIVQSIAAQTFRGEGVEPQRRRDFEDRLSALSRVHNLLTRERWEAAELGDVVRQSIAPFDAQGGRFTLAGPRVLLPPKTAVALALAVHELSTNASKYGALSRHGGSVEVAWALEEERLTLDWTERGGPEVTPPATRGFGSRMIERGLSAELGGAVSLSFPREGLRCRIEARIGAD